MKAGAWFIGIGKDLILEGHHKLLWMYTGRINVRSLGGVLFLEWCIERMTASSTILTRALWRLC